MKKKLTLWIFLFPLLLAAQDATYKNGTITIDFGKKKRERDSIQQLKDQKQQQSNDSDDEDNKDSVKARKIRDREAARAEQSARPDYAKNGLFQLLFHGGINACQVDNDGDVDPAFSYPGAEVGLGTMIRLNKTFSVSLELNYSMKGQKQSFLQDSLSVATSRQQFRVATDYLEVPLAVNIHTLPYHGQKLMFFHLGVTPAVLVRFKEINSDGQNITSSTEQPKRFEFSAFAGLYFVIAEHYSLGLNFQYGFTKVRGYSFPGTARLLGEHNILLNVDFMYMMNTVKKKK